MTTNLKTILIAIAGAILAALIGFVWYGGAEHAAYVQSKAQSAILTKQYSDYVASAKVALDKAKEDGQKWHDQAIANQTAADVAEQKIPAIQAALDAERARTKTLTPDALAGAVNLRIGANQSLPVANGTFSFTRPGAESTLNLFLQGEAAANKYAAEQIVSSDLRSAIDSSKHELDALGQRLTLVQGEYDLALPAWQADKNSLKFLERSILGLRIKTFVEGGIVFSVALTILHLTKIIK